MIRSPVVKGYLYVILSAVIFGCMPTMVTFLNSAGVNSLTVVFLRNLLSAPVLAILALRQRSSLRLPGSLLVPIGFMGIMGCCVTPALLFSSYGFIASGTATVFHFVYPAAVVLGGVLFLKERLTLGNLISVLICVTGIFLFYRPGEPLDWRGCALALLSGVTFAVYILLLSGFHHPEIPGFVFSFYVALGSSAAMLLVCLLSGQLTLPDSPMLWAAGFFFALLVNVGGVVLFQQGTFLIGGQRASILSTLEPITSIFLGVLVLHETVGLRTAAGTSLVILASILIVVFDMLESRKRTR